MSSIERDNLANSHAQQTINVVVAALGGQGGGVLLDWLAGAARSFGWPTQATSVPGVAQRTGATVYYLELFPADETTLPKPPVMSLFPMPGTVDLVVASEVVEAGRMVQRGFVSADRTTLVTSNHRVYAIAERAAVDNAVVDAKALREIADTQAKDLIMFDMQAMAERHNTVISATLLGAIAATGALPFPRDIFEEQIRSSGIQVETNLAAFDEAFSAATSSSAITKNTIHSVQHHDPRESQPPKFQLPGPTTSGGRKILGRIQQLPQPCHETLYHGSVKLADYLDHDYADEYLKAVEEVLAQDDGRDDYRLTNEFARQLALWLGFEDIIRVAHLKIKKSRNANLRTETGADDQQIVEVRDYFKPRVEEICGVLPEKFGTALLASKTATKILTYFTAGKRLASSHVGVFFMLRSIASLRRFRRHTLAHIQEAKRIDDWRGAIASCGSDVSKATALARSAALVKGYGATRERGYQQITHILTNAPSLPAQSIEALYKAGLEDDESRAFTDMTENFGTA